MKYSPIRDIPLPITANDPWLTPKVTDGVWKCAEFQLT